MMLKHTKAAILETFDFVKTIISVFQLLIQTVYVGYVTYRLFVKTGELTVNIILLILASAYLIFQLLTIREFYTKRQLINRRWIRWAYKLTKYSVNAYIIVMAIQSLNGSQTGNANMGVVITTTLMIGGIVLSIFSEVITLLINKQIAFISNSFLYDMDTFKANHEKKTWVINKLGLDLDEMFPRVSDRKVIERIKKVRNRQELKKVRKIAFKNKN